MGHILLVCRSGPAAERISSYRLPITLRACESARQAPIMAREFETLALLVDLCDDSGASTAPAIEAVRTHDHELPIVLWCPPHEAATPRFLDACRAGVTGVLFQSSGAFEQYALSQLVPRGTLTYSQWVEGTLHRTVPREVRRIVDICLHRASNDLTVPQLARQVGMARRTLTDHMTHTGLPPARALLEWGKLLRAAWDLEHSDLTIERIALEHGYGAPSAMRAALKRRTGDGPTDLRGEGGFGWALRCFERDLRRARRRGIRA